MPLAQPTPLRTLAIAVAAAALMRADLRAQLSMTATVASPLQLQAWNGPGTTVAAGAALPNGFVATDTGSGGATATFGVTSSASAGQLTYSVSDGYTFGFVPQPAIAHCSTGPHETVIAISGPAGPVAVQITWTHNVTGQGAGAWVDVGDDGSIEWQGYWDLATRPVTIMAGIGGTALRIRTHTASSGTFESLFQRATGTGPSQLRIDVAPCTAGLRIVSGAAGSAPAGQAFPQPVVLQVEDVLGTPVAGAPVTFTTVGPVTATTASPQLSDAQGRVTIALAANAYSVQNGETGLAHLIATTAGVPTAVTTPLFVDQLEVGLVPSAAGVLAETAGPAADVPYVLIASVPGVAPLPTPYGRLDVNPLDPATVVVEDAIGFFGFPSLGGAPAIGAPSFARFYNLPPGFLTGVTLQFQAIGAHPLRGLFLTDAVQATFQ